MVLTIPQIRSMSVFFGTVKTVPYGAGLFPAFVGNALERSADTQRVGVFRNGQDRVLLRCPKNASGLRLSSHFSTAATPYCSLHPPPAALANVRLLYDIGQKRTRRKEFVFLSAGFFGLLDYTDAGSRFSLLTYGWAYPTHGGQYAGGGETSRRGAFRSTPCRWR